MAVLNNSRVPHPVARSCPAAVWKWIPIAVLVIAVSVTPALESQSAAEYKYQVVYLYNFLHFVDWPSRAFVSTNANVPIVIGILGNDPFGTMLEDATKNEVVKGHPVAVRRFARVEQANDCHLLYIASAESPRLSAIMTALDREPVLTVSDMASFAKRGGAVQFYVEKDRLRFEINLEAIKKADLKISSQMLKLARLTSPQKEE